MSNRLKNVTVKYKIFWLIYWGATIAFLVIRREDVLRPLEEGESFGPLTLGILFAAIAAAALISHLVLYGRRDLDFKGREMPGTFKWYHLIFLILNCVLCVFLMEWVNNPDLKEMQIRYMLLNLAGCFIISMIWLFWLNSWRRSIIAVLCLYGTMVVIFYAVNTLRGEPFQFIDVFSLGTAMDVAGNFTFIMSRQLVAAIVIVLCVMGY